ncbi:FHA domain-containing protein [bacterium]|nr:FHA domain-containing protein [bacterium]
MPKFTIKNRKTGTSQSVHVKKDQILIGRRGKNDISLDSETISRKHAEIIRMNNDFYLVDLESGNGTLLNNKALKPHEKNLLTDKDNIRVEEFDISFEITEEDQGIFEDQTDSGIIEIKMIKKVLSALDVEALPRLEGISPETKGRKVTLTDDIPELAIGRDPTCQFSIDSNVISRKHAVLSRKWGGITLTDNNSKNGTYVNNRKVNEATLKDGDTITLGTIKFLFRNPQDIDMEALTRDYENKAKLEAEKLRPVEEEKPQPKKEEPKKEEQISPAAKMSVEDKKEEPKPDAKPETKPEPEVKAEEPKKEETPKSEEKSGEPETPEAPKPTGPKLKFDTLEIVLMAAGGIILVAALGLILYLL